MVDNKSKTSLIRLIQKNISLMKINNIILMLRTCIILSSSFVTYFFCKFHSGSFPIVTLLCTVCGIGDTKKVTKSVFF